MSELNKIISFFLLSVLFSCSIKKQDKFNLGSTTTLRFEVSDMVWPVSIGEANVCLWNDDKLSAVSITIDDNIEEDIPFWKAMQQKYGFTFTWFVITEAEEKYNVKCWECFKELSQLGNSVQAHDDRNWFENPKENLKNTSIDAYVDRLKTTQYKININIKNQRCLTYAYPWGEGNEQEVSKLFIASRGVIGLLNQVNKINYNRVNSISNPHIYGDDTSRNKYILPLITKTATLENINYYRGWLSTHFHGVSTEEKQFKTKGFLNYLKEKDSTLWIANFIDVVKYSQEYATHTLKIDKVLDNKILLTLTDKMMDSIYNMPLTIKVRVPNNWKSINVTQHDKVIESKVVVFQKNNYAFIKAVPDKGKVVIKNINN